MCKYIFSIVMNQTKISCGCLSLEQVKNSGTSFTCNLCVIRRYCNKRYETFLPRYLVWNYFMWFEKHPIWWLIRVMFNTSLGFSWMELSVFEMLLQKMVPCWFVSTLMVTRYIWACYRKYLEKIWNKIPSNFVVTAML